MVEETEIVRAPDPNLIRELALVLYSVGIPHRVVGNQHSRWIVVPSELALPALEQLADYHRENVGKRRRVERFATYQGSLTHALLWCVLLSLMQVLAQSGALGFDWRARGMVDGARMPRELWRCVTALTLHSDLAHLFSNLAFGGVLIALLVQVLRPGLAWSAVILSGALGNLVNVWLSGAGHRSLGASTAVFAALGVLTAIQLSRKLRSTRARMTRWVPLIAGALLLAWNGMGGASLGPGLELQGPRQPNTDIGAHVSGFLCGLPLGASAWKIERHRPLSAALEAGLLWLAPTLFLASWALALSA